MKQNDIPVYKDPDDFQTLGNAARFPCSTNRMRYDTLTHRYYLMNETLETYDIRHEGDQTLFIEDVTEDVYGAILDLAPFNYQFMCYLIASSQAYHFPDKYTARRQFEKALIYQAQYRVKNVDVRELNGIDIEGNNNIYHKQLRKEHRHISPKSLEILKGLGLLFNGNIPAKHLISYSEVM